MSELARGGFTSRVNKRLFLLTLLTVVLASLASAGLALSKFNHALRPALDKKASAVAHMIRDDLLLAIGAKIPFDAIPGMELYLQEVVAEYPEVVFVQVTDAAGARVYHGGLAAPPSAGRAAPSGDAGGLALSLLPAAFGGGAAGIREISSPIVFGGKTFGQVAIGLDGQFINSQLTDVFFDIAIILVAVLLVSLEVIIVLILFNVTRPIERMEEAVGRQSNGDFAAMSVIATRDEVGRFLAYLNDSAGRLRSKYGALFSQYFGAGEPLQVAPGAPAGAVEGARGGTSHLGARIAEIGQKFNLRSNTSQDEIKGNLVDARIPLFVFSFAEELQKSFMPLYVDQLYEPIPFLPQDLVIGLPISIYMLVILLVTPFAGGWADRFGARRMFMAGLLPAVAGFIGCGLAGSIHELILWRGTTAFGYAIITIACQGYIASIVTAGNRATGMAVFVGVLMSATMCGTAIGGILADRIGYRPVFFVAAGFALFAGALAYAMLNPSVRGAAAAGARRGIGNLAALLKNLRFMTLVLAAAIPAKIVLTGFLFFLVPLYLAELEASPAEIGRIMMVYSLLIIPLSPLAARCADRLNNALGLVALGTLLSGVALIALHREGSIWAVLMAVATVGIAHALLKAPLIAAALEAGEEIKEVGRTTLLGILRSCERIGSVIGPLLVGLFLTLFGFEAAMALLGAIVLGFGLVLGCCAALLGPAGKVRES